MLSVVVTAHARPARLRACLDALAVQEDVEFELVVAADGATDAVLGELEGLDEQAAAWSRAAVLRLEPGRGPAAARNAGWHAAGGAFVAFTDDDCVPAPGWARALLVAAGGVDAVGDVVVQGAVEPIVAERDRIGPFARTLWVRGAGPFFQTANVLYPRALLERLGGFDERFPAPAGEDTDLGRRALELGARAVFAPAARVEHAVHEPGWRGLVTDAPRWGSAVRLVKRHPGLRREFVHRVFWKPSHEALVVAAVAAAVAVGAKPTLGRWSGANGPGALGVGAVLAVGRYTLVHRGEHPSTASLVRSLPAHLAVDAAEVAAMARGSLRERTLFL